MKKNLLKNLRATLLISAFIGFGLGQARAFNLTDGLVAYWPLDVINGDNTSPDAGNFNDTLTAFGAPVVGAGQFGNAITLSGTSQYLDILHTTNFNDAAGLPVYNAPAGYTITLWVKAPAVGAGGNVNDHYLFSEGSTTNNNPLLLLQTRNAADTNAADTNKLSMAIRAVGGTFILNQVKSTNVVFDNNWHHIAWVDNHGSARLYVDGNLDPANFNYTYTSIPMNLDVIGGLARSTVASFFKGSVDNVAIWERPLTQAEVQSVFSNSIPTPVGPQPPIIVVSPVSRTNAMGDRATFTVGAIGLHPLTFNWYKDGNLLPTQTGTTLSATDLTTPGTNVYTIIVSNQSGSATNTATLTVLPDTSTNPANGIISYWPMDAVNITPTSTNTPDVYYSHTDLGLKFMDQNNVFPGHFSNSLVFNGTSSYGQRIGGAPVYTLTNYTIAFWANGSSSQVNKILYGEGDPSGTFFLLGTENSSTGTGLLNVKVSPNTSLTDKKSTRAVFDNNWHHVCWVDEGGNAKLYIDGVLDETDYTYSRTNILLSITSIGALVRSSPSLYFSGFLDDVAVWNRRLSYSEIQQIITNSIPLPSLTVATIVQNPVSATNAIGDRDTLVVNATGSSPLTYQWFKDGVAINGETNSALVLLKTTGATNNYSVIVNNPANIASTSTVAQVSYVPDPPVNLTNGLFNYWPLDTVDPTTNSTPDLASHDDLYLMGMDSSALVPGWFGNSLYFNGFNQYAQRVGGVPIYLVTNYSVSLWVNASSGQLNKMVYAEGGVNGNFFLLGTENNGTPGGSLNVKVSPGMNDRKSTRTVFDNTWHHVVWVDRNGQGKLYIDGVIDETDYTYTRTNVSLQTSALAGLVRATTTLFLTGQIDEVGVWSRGLSWTEIQQIYGSTIPVPTAPTPPAIVQQPTYSGALIFAGDAISLSVLASGTLPLNYQWQQNGTNVDGSANPSALTSALSFGAIQTSNAGNYAVVITNDSGIAVTSSVVNLAVIPYVATVNGTALALDFDSNNSPNIQPGFAEMTLSMNPTNFNGVTVAISPIGTVTFADRQRVPGILDNPPLLTQSRLYNDFIFVNNITNGTGIRILITRLAPNTQYGLTIWSWDAASIGPRASDWVEALSGQPIVSGYSFDGSIGVTSDYDFTFGALVTSSANGQLQIEGRSDNGANTLSVFMNALQLVANPAISILNVGTAADGNIQLIVQSKYPGQPIIFQESPDLTPGSWQQAADVVVTQTHGPIVYAEFPRSSTQLFYRVMQQ